MLYGTTKDSERGKDGAEEWMGPNKTTAKSVDTFQSIPSTYKCCVRDTVQYMCCNGIGIGNKGNNKIFAGVLAIIFWFQD
jgi:hypothetical protein